ncbi:MAG: hypothetical protein JF564_02105 [Sphingomonas sp.]|nr:hypothetical protein [Sphingomonas sp.]
MMHLRWDVAAVLVRRGKRGKPSEAERREGVLAALIEHVVAQPVAEQRQYIIYADGHREPLDATNIQQMRCRPDFPC